jgi:hypothetical protein
MEARVMRCVSGRCGIGIVAMMVVATFMTPARADVVYDIGVGLAYTGFNVEGYENRLSGGVDFRISRNFLGNPLDFGALDLTFQGPISLELSTARRLVPQLDVNLTTAMTSRSTAVPLSYEFNSDMVGQSVEIPGTVLVDTGFTIDGLGFYDFELTFSSRQETLRDGEPADETAARDFDIGPIAVSGNIYADAVVLITEPIYNRLGQDNPFSNLRVTNSFSDLLMTSADTAKRRLASGVDPVAEDESALLAAVPLVDLSPGLVEPIGLVALLATVHNVGSATVPEPTVLVLMLAALPAFVRRRTHH